ncbi:MAG TPA: DoxX family membrane protein [Puia sp.]
MEKFGKTGRIFYGLAIAATGFQQFFFKKFFHILFPPLPFQIPGLIYFSYLVASWLIIAGIAIVFSVRVRFFAYTLACLFLIFFIFCYVPFELFLSPYSPIHLGLWISPLKEFAYAGGAFAIANKIPADTGAGEIKTKFTGFLDKIAPYGRIMFAITMTSFGVSHFYYTKTVQDMVPDWIPSHLFWTWFAGIALIGAGIAIILNFQIRLIGNLLGIMIFLWFIVLHIPGAIANPLIDNGNEVTSAFSALAFSGIAFIIANGPGSEKYTRLTKMNIFNF